MMIEVQARGTESLESCHIALGDFILIPRVGAAFFSLYLRHLLQHVMRPWRYSLLLRVRCRSSLEVAPPILAMFVYLLPAESLL